MSDYEKYQLQWMIDHGYSLRALMDELTRLQFNDPEDSNTISTPVSQLFEIWEADVGFGSEIWACHAEWKDEQFGEKPAWRMLYLSSRHLSDGTLQFLLEQDHVPTTRHINVYATGSSAYIVFPFKFGDPDIGHETPSVPIPHDLAAILDYARENDFQSLHISPDNKEIDGLPIAPV